MSRSPLAYPLTRGIDGDSGGAADLQTDIMRFMAILALCLVAIFALVQSLPIEAQTPPEPIAAKTSPPPTVSADDAEAQAITPEQTVPAPVSPGPPPVKAESAPSPPEPAPAVALTRPKWVSGFEPRERPFAVSPPAVEAVVKTPAAPSAPPPAAPAPPAEQEGFTLRFESDIALTRLVAAGRVGFYAINAERAQRMTVSDSRISFWDASTPNSFHEMDAGTVPRSVVDALGRTGADASIVDWGVTLPGKLSSQLRALMSTHKGGSLVIRADGNLVRETGQ